MVDSIVLAIVHSSLDYDSIMILVGQTLRFSIPGTVSNCALFHACVIMNNTTGS